MAHDRAGVRRRARSATAPRTCRRCRCRPTGGASSGPAPSVRAVAPSQSLPTPKTHDPRGGGQRRARRAGRGARPPLDAPTPPAPAKATTVSDWSIARPGLGGGDGARGRPRPARSPSRSPTCRAVLARRTSDQVSPPPETVAVWPPRGPSEDDEGQQQVAGLRRRRGPGSSPCRAPSTGSRWPSIAQQPSAAVAAARCWRRSRATTA